MLPSMKPSPFDDLRCPNPKCEKHKKGGEGALTVVAGTETDPVLKCKACGGQNPWRWVLRVNLNLVGTSIAGGLFSAAVIAVAESPIGPAARILFGVGALGAVGGAVWNWARYAGRVVDTKIKLRQAQEAPLDVGPLPPEWQSTRAMLVKELNAIPQAKEILWTDLLQLDARVSDAYGRLNSLRSLTDPQAEARLKKEIEERRQSQQTRKSQRAIELQEEAIKLLQQRLDDIPKQRIREEEIHLSLQAATQFLENLRIKLLSLRDTNAGRIEEESKLMALDLKGRLAEIEALLE